MPRTRKTPLPRPAPTLPNISDPSLKDKFSQELAQRQATHKQQLLQIRLQQQRLAGQEAWKAVEENAKKLQGAGGEAFNEWTTAMNAIVRTLGPMAEAIRKDPLYGPLLAEALNSLPSLFSPKFITDIPVIGEKWDWIVTSAGKVLSSINNGYLHLDTAALQEHGLVFGLLVMIGTLAKSLLTLAAKVTCTVGKGILVYTKVIDPPDPSEERFDAVKKGKMPEVSFNVTCDDNGKVSTNVTVDGRPLSAQDYPQELQSFKAGITAWLAHHHYVHVGNDCYQHDTRGAADILNAEKLENLASHPTEGLEAFMENRFDMAVFHEEIPPAPPASPAPSAPPGPTI